MNAYIDQLILYLDYPFVRHAIIVGVAVALCASLLGVVLVLKRYSYIGNGLTHIAFGAIAIAKALRIADQMLLVLPLTVLFSVLLMDRRQGAFIKGDAAIAMLTLSALAIGYMLLNAFPGSANISGDVCTTLFGSTSILTLSKSEVYISLALSGSVIALFLGLYHRIFALTFDEDFATATGTSARAYNILLAVVIAIVVVMAMNLMGSLLITALLIFPALSAMRVLRSFRAVTLMSAALSVVCALVGKAVAIVGGTPVGDTPVGGTIVVVNLACFVLFSAAGAFRTRRTA